MQGLHGLVESVDRQGRGCIHTTDTDDVQPKRTQLGGAGNGAVHEVRKHRGVTGIQVAAEAARERRVAETPSATDCMPHR